MRGAGDGRWEGQADWQAKNMEVRQETGMTINTWQH